MGRRRRQPCGFGVCRKAHDLTLICALVPDLSSRIPRETTVFLDGAAFPGLDDPYKGPASSFGQGCAPCSPQVPQRHHVIQRMHDDGDQQVPGEEIEPPKVQAHHACQESIQPG